MSTRVYRLKAEWQHVQGLEAAIQIKLEEANSLAQRQGGTVRLGRIPEMVMELLEEVPSKRTTASGSQAAS